MNTERSVARYLDGTARPAEIRRLDQRIIEREDVRRELLFTSGLGMEIRECFRRARLSPKQR